MKKFYAILLIFVISPFLLLFSSCDKKNEYLVTDFYNTYLSISEESELLTKIAMPEKFQTTNTQIVSFVYSSELSTKMSTINSFSYIETLYNTMLDDAMGPVYLYGNMLINARNLSDNDAEYLFNQLFTLKRNYIEIATRLGDLERCQDISTASTSLEKLYSSYENAIKTAINLSSKISSIYYNQIMQNPNVNYITIHDNKINLEDVAVRTLNRLVYYKLVYVNIYLETQIIGCNIPHKIVSGTFNSYYQPYNDLKDKVYSTVTKQNIEDNRQQIIDLARTLYSIQLNFETEYQLYQYACDKIIYGRIDEKSNPTDIGYKQLIDSFISENGIAYQSYLTISEILDLCY